MTPLMVAFPPAPILHGYILLVISAVAFWLAFYLLRTGGLKSQNRRAYAYFVASIALWIWSVGVMYLFRAFGEFEKANLVDRFFGLVSITFIAATFLYFSYLFPYRKFALDNLHRLLAIIPIVLVVGILISPLHSSILANGILYPFFWAYFLSYWVVGTIYLLQKYRTAEGIHRWLLKKFLIGASTLFVIGITTYLIQSWFMERIDVGWLGPELTSIWLGFTIHFMFKKRPEYA